jgi:hypothetical protein
MASPEPEGLPVPEAGNAEQRPERVPARVSRPASQSDVPVASLGAWASAPAPAVKLWALGRCQFHSLLTSVITLTHPDSSQAELRRGSSMKRTR